MKTGLRLILASVALGTLVAGCTVHETAAPNPTGPSTNAHSLQITILPDRISQDGASQSAVAVLAIGPNGQPEIGRSLRMDMLVGGQLQDFGTLSARSIVTGTDGIARVVFTAPPSSGPISQSVNTVEIRALALGTNSEVFLPVSGTISLMPLGVILPPAGTPTAAFTMSPTQALMNVPVTFDASNSTKGSGASQISSYAWSFGDGTQASGKSVTHTFTSQQTFNVTLTVTNDRGLSASTVTPVAVGALSAPAPKVVFSPTAPAVGQTVVFNADQSVAAPGHSIVTFNWNFGDGTTGTGSVTSHVFGTAGTYNVVLSERDDTDQVGTTSVAVTVTSGAGGGGGGAATNASFVYSPLTPSAGQPIFFNAALSTAAAGRTLTTYAWDFGDGTSFSASVATATHSFTAAGKFSVTLVVTDDSGQKATTKTDVTVAGATAGSLTADFSISPTDPTSGQLVSLNGNLSSPIASINQFDWDFGDGTVQTAVGVNNFLMNHTYNTVTGNTFTIRLTVHDISGNVATTTHAITVKAGTDPQAQFTMTPNPATLVGGSVTVSFNGVFSTAGAGSIINYQWNFGDGSALGTGVTPSHPYTATGNYTITLTVTQTNGRTASTSRTLIVQ